MGCHVTPSTASPPGGTWKSNEWDVTSEDRPIIFKNFIQNCAMNSLMCGRVLFLATLCLQVFLLPTSVIYRLATKCVRCACDWRPVTSAMVWVCLVQLLSIRRRSSTSSAHRLKPFSPLSSAEVQIRAGRFSYKKNGISEKVRPNDGPIVFF